MKKMILGIDGVYFIGALSVVFSITTNLIGRKLGIKKRTSELRKITESYQKDLKAATDKNDSKEIERLKGREPEMMKAMQEMMFLPLKNMVFVVPLFFVVIWFVTSNYHSFAINLPIGIHPSELLSLNVFRESTYGARGYFIFVSIFAGLFIEAALNKVFQEKKGG